MARTWPVCSFLFNIVVMSGLIAALLAFINCVGIRSSEHVDIFKICNPLPLYMWGSEVGDYDH